MSQFNFGNLESPLPGSVLINDNLEPWRDAIHSLHSGPSRPPYAIPGMAWVNNTTNPWVLNMFTGSADIPIGYFDTDTDTFTPAGVSQAAADVSYDNSGSGLLADNVQDAIDEAYNDFETFANRPEGFATASQGALAATALQPGQADKTTIVDPISATGTSVNFLSLPAGVKEIRVNINNISFNGTGVPMIQLGDAGGFKATGYMSTAFSGAPGGAAANFTAGFGLVNASAAAYSYSGTIILTLADSVNNTWTLSGSLYMGGVVVLALSGGLKTLSQKLDRVRLTSSTGTDTFDSGTVGAAYTL